MDRLAAVDGTNLPDRAGYASEERHGTLIIRKPNVASTRHLQLETPAARVATFRARLRQRGRAGGSTQWRVRSKG